jgi:hypothetical protein
MSKRSRALAACTGAALVAGCAGAAIAAGGGGARTTTRYATTPTGAGAINPRAIPLGDGYVSSTPKVGYVDSCQTQFMAGAGGSQVDGPWIDPAAHTWNDKTKLTVNGSIHWPSGYYRVTASGSERKLSFNDLPIDHNTGVFPIAATDPAYRYDMNPNHIAAQTFNWTLPLHPKAASPSSCAPMGPIGVLRDGVVLYNALDAQGRDAGAHEVLDLCAGHPDPSFTYHHHDVPPCILRTTPNGRSTLVGYALDGYGIYVQKDKHGNLPSNRQLDPCHGTTSKVMWNGKLTRVYHYVATLEYPYTVGCFHGTPTSSGRTPPPTG